jgi:dienelactone hydrolase
VIGIWKNSQLIADQFAANGYYTLMVDMYRGDALTLNRPAGFDFMQWRGKHTVKEVDPVVEAGVKFLKDKGFKKIGAVGYCFGAKYVCRFLDGRGVDVGYCAHPVSQFDPVMFTWMLAYISITSRLSTKRS